MLGAWGWEGLGALSHTLAPLLCSSCPWALVTALLFVAFGAGACIGSLLTLVVTSGNCRRFLWYGFYGFLGVHGPVAAGPAPARRRLREYRE